MRQTHFNLTLDCDFPSSKAKIDAVKLMAVVTYKTCEHAANNEMMAVSFDLVRRLHLKPLMGHQNFMNGS